MGQYQNGLFGCFNNFGVCILSYFAPCYVHGKNAEFFGENCVLCGLGVLVPIVNIVIIAQTREKIRARIGMEGPFWMDLLLTCLCGCCVLAQDRQEVLHMSGGGAGAAPLEAHMPSFQPSSEGNKMQRS